MNNEGESAAPNDEQTGASTEETQATESTETQNTEQPGAGEQAAAPKPKKERRKRLQVTDEEAATSLAILQSLSKENIEITSKALSDALEQADLKKAKSILAKLKRDGHVKVISTRNKDIPVIYGLTA